MRKGWRLPERHERGLPASMLMASLQASLRILGGKPFTSGMVQRLNRCFAVIFI
jgi:hypothetical protein